jgi:hypothetical protein
MRQRWGLVALTAGVLALHLAITHRIVLYEAEARSHARQPPRMRVTYVRELALQAPVSVVAAIPPSPSVSKVTPALPPIEPGATMASWRAATPPVVQAKKVAIKKPRVAPVADPSALDRASAAPAFAASAPPDEAPLMSSPLETADTAASAAPLLLPERPMWTESAPRPTPSAAASGASELQSHGSIPRRNLRRRASGVDQQPHRCERCIQPHGR